MSAAFACCCLRSLLGVGVVALQVQAAMLINSVVIRAPLLSVAN
jgi:hypothetical protein